MDLVKPESKGITTICCLQEMSLKQKDFNYLIKPLSYNKCNSCYVQSAPQVCIFSKLCGLFY